MSHASTAAVLTIALLASSCSGVGNGEVAQPVEDEATTTSLGSSNTDTAKASSELADIAGQLLWRTSSGSIVVSNPDGSDQEFLAVREDAFHTQPTWSNNGEQVAWTSIGRTSSMLSIARSDGTEVRSTEVTSPAFYLFWSPDDTRLGGLRQSSAGLELFIAEAASAEARSVGPGQPFYIDWIDDDALVAAVGGSQLIDISASTTEAPSERALANNLGIFQAPIAFADGDALIALDLGTSNSLARVSPTGETTIIATAAGPLLMAEHPSTTKISVLVATTEPQAQVISFAAGQSETDDLPELAAGKVSIIDLATGEIETRPEANVLATSWSPDGATLAMLQFGPNAATWLFVRDGEVITGEPFTPSDELSQAYLPFADQYDRSSTWWSPDSKAFVMAGSINGEAAVWVDVIDDGGPPINVGLGDVAFWSPQ